MNCQAAIWPLDQCSLRCFYILFTAECKISNKEHRQIRDSEMRGLGPMPTVCDTRALWRAFKSSHAQMTPIHSLQSLWAKSCILLDVINAFVPLRFSFQRGYSLPPLLANSNTIPHQRHDFKGNTTVGKTKSKEGTTAVPYQLLPMAGTRSVEQAKIWCIR